jgi:hypothetical protein
MSLPKYFNWQAYLQLNSGKAGIRTEQGAIKHWFIYGYKENRKYNSLPKDYDKMNSIAIEKI